MENDEKQRNADAKTARASIDSSPIHSDGDHKSPLPRARSPDELPAKLSVSSDESNPSSLSHGFSPREEKLTASPPGTVPEKPPSPVTVVNRSVQDEPKAVTKVDPRVGDGIFSVKEEEVSGGGSGRRLRPSLSILRRVKREKMLKKAALGFRIFGLLFCMIAFSVMAADKNQGWALDSFDRYKEFRYCVSVTVIGFVYSAAQASDLLYHLATGKYVVQHQLRYFFDFAVDQMLAYLLISASSSAATRVDDWKSNWGEDKFPNMANASVAMTLLAFVAFAANSLISGYALCTSRST